MTDIDYGAQIGELTAAIRELSNRYEEARNTDGGRKAAALDGQAELAAQAAAAQTAQREAEAAARKAEIAEAVRDALKNVRSPSLAGIIGQGPTPATERRVIPPDNAHPALKASFRDYVSGELITGILDYRGMGAGGLDPEAIMAGKAKLTELGLDWMGVPAMSKATLGATGATGGYVLPNNLVDTVVKPSTQAAVYTGANPLVTVISGVSVRGVDQPYRTGAPSRMTFQDWGETKENVDLAYGSYTAYLGTIARIYDLGKQYVRFSAGAAERDVVDELTRAAALAENYYVIAGAGTGTIGSGDPTTGVYTALLSGANTYKTAFAGASNSTVAGSLAAAIAGAHASLAARSRTPTAAVVDATTYFALFTQGSDNAGFWMSQLLGAGFSVGADNQVSWRGTPIYYDVNLGTNAATKIAIVGDWKALKFYRGLEFRIDTSDVAGTRWDKNLIGFRGEEEIGFNASSAVSVGAFQLVTAVIP